MKIKSKIAVILCAVFLLLATALVTGCNKVFTRAANNDDIYVDLSVELSISISYKVKPNVDINNLKIQFSYYDENDTLLTQKTKNVGSVTKGKEVTVHISFPEFSLTDLVKIKKTQAEVIGGTVPKFDFS
ncbi:MAG: hypothetical protein K2K60_02375 [Clostridia bacterium]|nr:hypothetical protein [Clostridia bacterium]